MLGGSYIMGFRKRKDDKYNNSVIKPDAYFGKNSILIMCITFILILGSLIFNTVNMRHKIEDDARNYIADISSETISNMSYILNENLLYVEELAESISRYSKEHITEEELVKRASHWGFDELGIVVKNGADIYDAFCYQMMELIIKQPQMYDKSMVSCINNHKIVYSAPLNIEGENDMLLIGTKNYETVLEFLNSTDFKGDGLSLITDGEGKLLFSPEREEIEELIHLDQIELESILANNSGIIEIENGNHDVVLANIQNLNINDWKLVTFIPQSVLVRDNLQPLLNYMIIIVLSALVFIGLMVYVTKSKRTLINQLREYSFVDPLTKGMNDIAFQYECKRLLASNDYHYAMVFLNIINFKQVNERWGIEEGNKVLKYIYRLIRENIDDAECFARSELDHYFILIRANSEELIVERLNALINRINEFINKPKSDGEAFSIDVVAGIYQLKHNGEDIKECQEKARKAESIGKNKQVLTFYNRKLVKRELYHKRLNDMFMDALKGEQFEVYLQPKVSLRDKKHAAEALIRWNHPEEGLIFPGDFIEVFEKNGKICELDVYVFEKVCKLLNAYKASGKQMFPISVNLSRAHLNSLDMQYINRIIDIKHKYDIPDNILELEMTESIMIENEQLPFIKNMIDLFHQNGIQCSLDDFGFGFSSLGILKSLDVDTIKLDRNFFIEETPKTWYIVDTFVNMAHGLNIKIVAEGIEFEHQVESLRKTGCDMIQGYYFGKPMKVSDYIAWYEKEINA